VATVQACEMGTGIVSESIERFWAGNNGLLRRRPPALSILPEIAANDRASVVGQFPVNSLIRSWAFGVFF